MFNEIIRKCLMGTVGGLFGIIVSHPFDTVKVRLQTMGSIDYGFGEHLYDGPIDCFHKIVKREGFLSLYKGLSVVIFSNIPITLLTFSGYEISKHILHGMGENLSYTELFFIGSVTGALPSVIVTPTELVKVKMQTPNPLFVLYPERPIGIVTRLYRDHGLKNIYRGIILTILRDMPATGVYFVTYEYLFQNPYNLDRYKHLEYVRSAFCGGIAGCMFWLIATPIDIIKTRYQSAKYPVGFFDVVNDLLNEAGNGFSRRVMLFYTGFSLLLIRAFLSHAAVFVGYDIYKRLVSRKKLIELFEETDACVQKEMEEHEAEERKKKSVEESEEEEDVIVENEAEIEPNVK